MLTFKLLDGDKIIFEESSEHYFKPVDDYILYGGSKTVDLMIKYAFNEFQKLIFD